MHACLFFRLREEAGVPVQNLLKHQENIQTSHRKLVAWIMFHVVYFNPYMFSHFQFMSCKIFFAYVCTQYVCGWEFQDVQWKAHPANQVTAVWLLHSTDYSLTGHTVTSPHCYWSVQALRTIDVRYQHIFKKNNNSNISNFLILSGVVFKGLTEIKIVHHVLFCSSAVQSGKSWLFFCFKRDVWKTLTYRKVPAYFNLSG